MTPAELLDLARKLRAEAEGWEARTKEAGSKRPPAAGTPGRGAEAWRQKVAYWHLMDVTQGLFNAARGCEDAARYMGHVKADETEVAA